MLAEHEIEAAVTVEITGGNSRDIVLLAIDLPGELGRLLLGEAPISGADEQPVRAGEEEIRRAVARQVDGADAQGVDVARQARGSR